jgi:hypothetical protein
MEKLHNEVMPDLMAWQKEKNRKRFPMDNPSQTTEGEKRRKIEKRKSEEKENMEIIPKKSKKEVESVKDTVETGSKITLLVTGAQASFLEGGVVKVLFSLIPLMVETSSIGDQSYYRSWILYSPRRTKYPSNGEIHVCVSICTNRRLPRLGYKVSSRRESPWSSPLCQY